MTDIEDYRKERIESLYEHPDMLRVLEPKVLYQSCPEVGGQPAIEIASENPEIDGEGDEFESFEDLVHGCDCLIEYRDGSTFVVADHSVPPISCDGGAWGEILARSQEAGGSV